MVKNGTIWHNGKDVLQLDNTNPQDFFSAAYQHLGVKYPKFYKMDNLSKLGWLTSEILLAGFDGSAYHPEEIGVVLANSSASLDADARYYDTVKDIASPALFVYTLPNIVIGEICIRNNFKGENAFFVQDEFDIPFIYEYVDNLLTSKLLNICLCGWVQYFKDDYKAALFLVTSGGENGEMPFTIENIKRITG